MGAGSCVDLRWVCWLMGGAGGFRVLLGFWVCARSLGDVGGLMLGFLDLAWRLVGLGMLVCCCASWGWRLGLLGGSLWWFCGGYFWCLSVVLLGCLLPVFWFCMLLGVLGFLG